MNTLEDWKETDKFSITFPCDTFILLGMWLKKNGHNVSFDKDIWVRINNRNICYSREAMDIFVFLINQYKKGAINLE